MFIQNGWITKAKCAQALGSLDLTQLKQRVSLVTGDFVLNDATEEDHWNLAIAINSLVDTPIKFTDDVMKKWDEKQTDRWLQTTGFPYELGDNGEDMLLANQDTLKKGCRKLVRSHNKSVTNSTKLPETHWILLVKQILKARDDALGRSGNEVRVDTHITFDKDKVLGSSLATVYKGTFDGQVAAIKRIVQQPEHSKEYLTKEARTLQEVSGPNIIQLFGHFLDNDFLYLAMEYADGGSLETMVQESKFQKWADRRDVCQQICTGLHHLHDTCAMTHCDIKPQNILFKTTETRQGKSLVVKICDFGLSRKVGFDHTHKSIASGIGAGTRKWMPPEGIRELGNKKMTTAERNVSYDVHPCAMVLFYVLSQGKYPFEGVRIDEVEQNIVKGRHVKELPRISVSGSSTGETGESKHSSSTINDLDDEMGRKEAMHLITRMLDSDPKRRPTMQAVLKHPFFMTPSEKLGLIRAGRDTKWLWLQNEYLNGKPSIRWMNLPRLKNVKTFFAGDEERHYRNSLAELARFIRNVREHVYDCSNGKTDSDLAIFFEVDEVRREDTNATDDMLVKYFASAVPNLFCALLKWPVG